MTLWQLLRGSSKGAPFWTQVRFWSFAVVLSPIIIGVYLGLWYDGYLEEHIDGD